MKIAGLLTVNLDCVNGRISDYCTKINTESKRLSLMACTRWSSKRAVSRRFDFVKETRKTSDESWFDKEGAKETVVWCHVSETVECLFDVLCRC